MMLPPPCFAIVMFVAGLGVGNQSMHYISTENDTNGVKNIYSFVSLLQTMYFFDKI